MARNDYGVNFNGRRVIHPGGYDATDADSMAAVASGGLNLPIVVGTSDAGKQGIVRYFSDLTSARSYLRGGDVLTALEVMFSPSADGGGGPGTIGVLIVNPTVQATLQSGGISQTAKEFGEGGNRIQCKMENGTLASTKKYTVTRWDLEVTEVYDNVGAVLEIQYSGNQAYASVSINTTNGKAVSLETRLGTDSASAQTDLLLDLTSERFATIDDVASYIASVSGYKSKVIDNRSSGLPSSNLDAISAQSILTTYNLLAIKGDLEYRVNNGSQLVNVQTSTSETLVNFPMAYLASGAKGSTPTSWSTFFDTLKKEFHDILVVLSSSASIHAEALAHVGEMLNRNQKQEMFTGGSTGESVEDVKRRAVGLNSSRAVLGYPGIYHSVNGGLTPLPAYFTGALLAGRVGGVDVNDPITFDYVSVLGLENDLVAGDPDIDDLITSGVCTLERVEGGGHRIVQGITTYLGGNNILYREISARRGADTISETMRKAMESKFVGKRSSRATPSAVNTTAIDVLEAEIRAGTIVAYSNISVRVTSGIIYVDYEVAQGDPINYVLVTTHFIPTSL